MIDRPKEGNRAVLVHLPATEDDDSLQEFRKLASSAGVLEVGELKGIKRIPNPKYFIGTGKLDDLVSIVAGTEADLVLFNNSLSPSQERNLEQRLGVRVLDRTELILDIFSQRAQTFEGKLQVELAQLKHLSTRLVRGWTHLERQKGGIGLRGPGETQLETDQRLIGARIAQIQKRLVKVDKHRQQGQLARKKSSIPVVAVVGYTNAGKSTLFNGLTGANVRAIDQVFATLDPTRRRLPISKTSEVILTDTVGFIRGIPHELIAAFRSTLQEASEADLLLHVIDATDPRMDETIASVISVLEEIGAGAIPTIEIFNKIDQFESMISRLEPRAQGLSNLWISAHQAADIGLVKESLFRFFSNSAERRFVHVNPQDALFRAKLYSIVNVVREDPDESGGWNLEIEVDVRNDHLFRALEAEFLPGLDAKQ